ncbi:MAG: two-component regulator propeller domain-containing protein [Cyclobacteriaceae bacterium]
MLSHFKVFFTAALLSICYCSQGQSNPYQHFNVAEGLPSSEVYKVFQDKKGFIWFATDNGVVRYDGKEMDLYQLNEGLSDPVVFDFFEDHQGRLWFRTFSGRLSYFKDEQIHSYPYNDTLAAICRGDFMQSMAIDTKDNLWFGTYKGCGVVNANGKLTLNKNVEAHHLELKKTETGIVYSHAGLSRIYKHITIDDVNIPFHTKDSAWNHEIICTIHWNNEKYFSLGSIIYKVDGNKIVPVFFGRDQIINLYVDRENKIWIGYFQNGADRCIDFNHLDEVLLPFIESMGVTCIFQDREGGYWFSTRQDGVYYVPDLSYKIVNPPIQKKIYAAISWNEKTLIGDDKGNLILLDKNGHVIKQHNIKGGIILSIAKSPLHDILWVSSSAGTYLFDESFNSANSIRLAHGGLCTDPNSEIWAVNGHQIFQYDSQGKASVTISTEKFYRKIYCTKSNILVFGRIGLDAFSYSSSHEKLSLPKLLDKLKISKVMSINDSLILVGTLGSGFLVVNEKNWTYKEYFSKLNFNANNIYDCQLVGSEIWLATEKGIAIVSSLENAKPKFSFITKKNGLVTDRVNHLTVMVENIWAYNDNSICVIPTKTSGQLPPQCYLQKITVNNISRSAGDLHLSYDENNLQFNYRFIDFKNQNIFIRHRILSTDQWSYSNDRSIRYYSLSPGYYRFELEYSLDNLTWHKTEMINFIIQPPFWRAWYFQVPLFVLISILGVTYYRRRILRLRERHNYLKIINQQQQNLIRAELETMERERRRIAKELHDSIGTNLSAIKMTIRRLMQKYNEPKSDEVETELQHTIQEIKDIIYELVPAGLSTYGLNEVIKGYAKKIKDNLGLDIEVQSFGPELKDPNLGLTAFRILQELLSNSLKHSEAKKVAIHINVFDDILNIIYQDDGKGFNSESVTKGSGLLNIQSRVQSSLGNLKFESGNFGVFYSIDLPLKK